MSDAAKLESRAMATVHKRRTSEAGDVISVLISIALIAAFVLVHWGFHFLTLRFALPALLAAGVFAIFGYIVRGVTLTGAFAGLVVTFILWIEDGWHGFAVLLAVFVLTWLATRVGRERKQRLSIAERGGGRTGLQVLANVGLAAAFCIFMPPFHPLWLCSMAVLAEAAADTVSSEIGKAIGGAPRLITTFDLVPIGTDGGITIAGTLAGVIAALAITVVALFADAIGLHYVPPIATGAIAGMLFDSLLGATLERKFLNNDAVNFISTGFAAVVAFAADRLFPLLY